MPKFTWLIEMTVDPLWVADGFDFAQYNGSKGNEACKERMAALLPYAASHEFDAKIVKAPDAGKVARQMGFTLEKYQSRTA